MIQSGDYIRQISSGQLFKVHYVEKDFLCTTRVPSSLHVHIPINDAMRVSAPSLLPGDPETTQRTAQ